MREIRGGREIEMDNLIDRIWVLMLYCNKDERKMMREKLERVINEIKKLEKGGL